MIETILKVKTTMPPLNPGVLEISQIKDRLEDNIDSGREFNYPLTLVSAPAGSGKTTTIRMWLGEHKINSAWLTLDQADNDPKRFWTYLISSLQNLDEQLGKGTMEILRSSGAGGEFFADNTFLIPLLNDLFNLEEPFFMVLDDLHLVDNKNIQSDLVFFIENIPPSFHLVTITRSDPPWPLHRWRAKEMIKEIRQKDLTLSREETRRYFNVIKGFDLQDHLLDKLYDKTEGWLTGLQLTALSLSETHDISSYIESFTGSRQNVLEYLSEEVLTRQPDEVREFLFQTSILKHLCPPLCNAVTGKDNSAAVLSELERGEVFVSPLDENNFWYRYHPLFADLLYHQPKKFHPEKIPELHEKAGQWFLEAGYPFEAVHHTMQSNNLERAAFILNENFDKINLSGGLPELASYFDRLPFDLLKQYPRLVTFEIVCNLVKKGEKDTGRTEELLEQADKLISRDNKDDPGLKGILAAAKAYYHISKNETALALEYVEEALEYLHEESYFWRSFVTVIAGDTRFYSGDLESAYELYSDTLQRNYPTGNAYLTLTPGLKTANCLYCLGRLKESAELTEAVLDMAKKAGMNQIPRVGALWTLLGELQREKGNLEEAGHFINRGLYTCGPEKLTLGWSNLFKVAYLFSCEKYQEALQTVEKVKAIDREAGLPRFISQAAASWECRILFELEELAMTRQALHRAGIRKDGKVQATQERGYLALARLLASENKHEQAWKIVERTGKFAVAAKDRKTTLEAQLTKATLAEQTGNTGTAEESLVEALQSGRETGYYQTYIDEGKSLAPVFSRILEGKHAARGQLLSHNLTGFAREISRAIAPDTGEQQASAQKTRVSDHAYERLILEELSPRELQILQMIAEGCSNQEIAQKFFLSAGTIKWHTSNIYGKLGVKRRTEAVALARKLGII